MFQGKRRAVFVIRQTVTFQSESTLPGNRQRPCHRQKGSPMKLKEIETIDPNFKVTTTLNEPDLRYYDARKAPFQIYGLSDPRKGPVFKRMPDSVAASVSEGVKNLNASTTGGRVRFSTDSNYIAIKAVMPALTAFPHMTLAGTSGFDLYIDKEPQSLFYKTFMPPVGMKDGYESILYFPDTRKRNVTIHFSIYSSVASLYIGLQKSSYIDSGAEYRFKKPVLYYGSSITQGGCTSRPGNTYPAIIARHLNRDFINFGFSGNAKGEPALAEYIAGLDISMLVCDYDHNAPDARYLADTHEKFYQKFRDSAPELPVLFISKPDFNPYLREDILRRNVIYSTYLHAMESGDRNVFFLDGNSLLAGRDHDCCTVDGCHPNDAGFLRMAGVIGDTIGRVLSCRPE